MAYITLVNQSTGIPVESNNVRLNGTYLFGGAELDRSYAVEGLETYRRLVEWF